MQRIKIEFEATPNPQSLKFKLPIKVTDTTHEFQNARDTEHSPLAEKLFGFPWVSSLMIGPDFVTLTKQDWVEWEVLSEPLAGLIGEHLERGEPIFVKIEDFTSEEDADDSELVKKIKKAIKTDIRPVVALDGGDVVFAKFESEVLYIHMRGACSSCPSSQMTLKEGIEVRMRELFPEIKEVRSL